MDKASCDVYFSLVGDVLSITVPLHSDARAKARLAQVEEHLRVEGAQEMDALVNTFGAKPYFVLNSERTEGRDGIRGIYGAMFAAFPDLKTEVKARYVCENAVILETVLSGTQTGAWNGIPATGKKVNVPMVAIFPIDPVGKLAAEIVYFDSAILLRQLGLMPAATAES